MSRELEKKLRPLLDAIKSGKKITFFNGAGVSTSAGIPDFRSPKTGLYANLAKLDLPYAEAVFDIDYFRENPKAFYTLTQELYPGKFAPTKFHYLVKLAQDKKLLKRVYTQNIDTLERLAGIEDEYIVEAHGSFARNHCIDCSEEMSTETLIKHMNNKDKNEGIPTCSVCKGYVKPDIVFFGEGLPPRFFDLWDEDAEEVEVALVAGTSLTVYPFASLPAEVSKKTLRVLVNKENVGDFKAGKRKTDLVLLHDCDFVAEKLCELLDWKDELDAYMEEATKKYSKNKEAAAELAEETTGEIKEVIEKKPPAPEAKEEALEDQISKLKIQ